MSAPTSQKSRKKLFLAIIAAVVVVIALVPPILAGGFTVPVSTVTFGETTGSLTPTTAQASVQIMTAYQYIFTVRTGGMVRTTDSDVSSSRGTVNITITLKLANPSNQTIDLGNVNLNGAIGTRNHTIYLSVDQGVRVPGSYRLDIVIAADVAPVGGIHVISSTTISASFTIS